MKREKRREGRRDFGDATRFHPTPPFPRVSSVSRHARFRSRFSLQFSSSATTERHEIPKCKRKFGKRINTITSPEKRHDDACLHHWQAGIATNFFRIINQRFICEALLQMMLQIIIQTAFNAKYCNIVSFQLCDVVYIQSNHQHGASLVVLEQVNDT